MNSGYVVFDINCSAKIAEILIAELSTLDIDSFLEKDTGFEFSIPENHPGLSDIQSLLVKYKNTSGLDFSEARIGEADWNLEWEKNFQPVSVENKVLIRAPFHPSDIKFETELLIQPKMTFGTGHHETTYLMILAMMAVDFKDKYVLDAGCGTGILSIFARKKEAIHVTAIDIDDWAVSNAQENVSLNNISGVTIIKGSVAEIKKEIQFGIILANINRNVLLTELPVYAGCHLSGGTLILSGFYENDARMIEETAEKCGYRKSCGFLRNGWCALVFTRNSDYFS